MKTVKVEKRFPDAKNLPLILFLFFFLFWLILALQPLERGTWLLENVLVFISVPVIIHSYFKNRLSLVSYLLLFVFLILHVIGAHYTYAEVPFGFTIGKWLGDNRNHYDRIIHFTWGALVFYPFKESLADKWKLRNKLAWVVPALCVIVLSDLFELFEWVAVLIVAPEQGTAYLGLQGDEWDAQKDMVLGIAGTLFAVCLNYLIQAKKSFISLWRKFPQEI